MITIDSVTRTYGASAAVDDASWTARPGCVTGFLGPNAPASRPSCGSSSDWPGPPHRAPQPCPAAAT